MLNPSQIAEMAAVKYPFVTDEDEGREQYFNRHITAQQQAYIAAFTDAMELMSKEWVPIPKDLFDLLCNYVKSDLDHPNKLQRIETELIYEKLLTFILPEPPVLTKDKKI